MAEVLQQQGPVIENHARDRDVLVQTLDHLLERYLNLLDQYQSQQQALSKHLSSGFLDLAQANFSNPNRIRYGQDFYDERMQASTRMYAYPPSHMLRRGKGLRMISAVELTAPLFSIDASDSFRSKEKDSLGDQISSSATSFAEESQDHERTNGSAQTLQDPLRWFGVLVAPALRSSQASFKHAVNNSVPALANVMTEMKEVEIEVRRTRKRLGKIQ